MALRAAFKHLVLAAAGLLCAGASAEPSFVPVFNQDFPDAFVLPHGSEFIAYATNNGPNVPIATSRDLVHWSFAADPASGKRRDALPSWDPGPKPASPGRPKYSSSGTGTCFITPRATGGRTCSASGSPKRSTRSAHSSNYRSEPIVCQTALGGSIDADPFRDADGKLFLYFKNDGNRVGQHTAIWGQPLAPDGLSVAGPAVELIHDDKSWEQRLVEAPTMVLSPAGSQLLFSAAFFGWNEDQRLSPYGMGYATCSGPLGPCRKSPDNPILHSFSEREAGCLSGPGHQSIFKVGNRTMMSFHAWAATSGCRKADDKRYLYVAPIFWKDGKPQIAPGLRP